MPRPSADLTEWIIGSQRYPSHEGDQVYPSLNFSFALIVSRLPFSPELAEAADYTLSLSYPLTPTFPEIQLLLQTF